MDWDVVDRFGFAGLRLGDRLSDVRARLGEHVPFRRTVGADLTDHFVTAGVLVSYGVEGTVSFLEVVEPARPRIAGVPLLGERLDDVVAALAARGVQVALDDHGGTVVGWGVGLWVPEASVAAVSIGEDR